MGEPAHKEGRERPAHKRGETPAQKSLEISKQRERDTCTEITGNQQTKGERRLHRKGGKTCKKEKRANSLHTKGESLEPKACKQKGKYTGTQSTRWWTKYLSQRETERDRDRDRQREAETDKYKSLCPENVA